MTTERAYAIAGGILGGLLVATAAVAIIIANSRAGVLPTTSSRAKRR